MFEFRTELPKNSLGKVLKDQLIPAIRRSRGHGQEGAEAMERMSTLDAGFFFVEHENVPMHLGSLAVFDGPAPGYEELIELFAAKLPLVPAVPPGGADHAAADLLRPCWVDDEHFEIGHHVRQATVPAPGGKRQLRELAAEDLREPAGPVPAAVGRRGCWTGSRAAGGRSCPRCTTAWWTASAATT